MDQETAQDIARSLQRISRILAGILLRDIEDGEQTRKIRRLTNCGFSNLEIAEMLNTSSATVRVAVNRDRKSRTRRG